jgi:hypothetical protein
MSTFIAYIPIAILLFTGLILLLWSGRRRTGSPGVARPADLSNFHPSHYKHFPQIRQALSPEDEEYIRRKLPPRIAKQVLRERRAVARGFLRGLREDFVSLELLGRTIAALSPVVSRQQETERLALSVQFRLLYALGWMSLFAGRLPVDQMEQLTALVGRLALRMEESITRISALAVSHQPRGISA